MKTDKKNPFAVEKLREHYAKVGNFRAFKKTYSSSFAGMVDHNTPKAWEHLLEGIPSVADPMTADRIARTARLVKPGPNSTLLDIGIGNGWVEEQLHTRYPGKIAFTGVDVTPQNLDALSKKIPGEFLKGDILDLPKAVAPQHYDYILLLEVLEHIPFVHTFQALETIKSLLAPEGSFIISVPINEDLETKIAEGRNLSHHVRRYTPEIIKAELRCAGFKVIEEHTLYAFNRWYRLKSLIARLTQKRKPNVIILKCQIAATVL